MLLQILDLLIGLTVVFLIFSTIASAFVELIENGLKRRSALLKQGLEEVVVTVFPELTGDARVAKQKAMVEKLFRTPHVASLYQGEYLEGYTRNLPSYIPTDRFVGAVRKLAADLDADFQKLKGVMSQVGFAPTLSESMKAQLAAEQARVETQKTIVDQAMQQHQAALQAAARDTTNAALKQAEADAAAKLKEERDKLDQARLELAASEAGQAEAAAIGQYFDQSMERVSGWYARHVSGVLFVLGFGIAAVFNVDTLKLAQSLMSDTDLRQRVVENATATVAKGYDLAVDNEKACAPTDEDCLHKVRERTAGQLKIAEELDLPIGWTYCEWQGLFGEYTAKVCMGQIAALMDAQSREPPPTGHRPCTCDWWPNFKFVGKLFGLLLTTIAIGAGAPFWFKLMSQLVELRNTVKPQPEAERAAEKAEGRSEAKATAKVG